MKKILSITLLVLMAFSLGYFFASRGMLTTAFTETSSNVLSRSFIERSSLYKLSRQGQDERLDNALEALILGDLVAMRELGFSNTSNAELLCVQLKELRAILENDVLFSTELDNVLAACE